MSKTGNSDVEKQLETDKLFGPWMKVQGNRRFTKKAASISAIKNRTLEKGVKGKNIEGVILKEGGIMRDKVTKVSSNDKGKQAAMENDTHKKKVTFKDWGQTSVANADSRFSILIEDNLDIGATLQNNSFVMDSTDTQKKQGSLSGPSRKGHKILSQNVSGLREDEEYNRPGNPNLLFGHIPVEGNCTDFEAYRMHTEDYQASIDIVLETPEVDLPVGNAENGEHVGPRFEENVSILREALSGVQA